MTIKEAVEEAKRVTRCAFDSDWMTRQIDDLEQLIQLNILLIASDSLTRYASYEEDKDRELLVRPPYDRIYVEWLIAQIDLRNGEYDKYAISYDVYNARWLSYSKWVALRIRPAGGQAVWQGYYIVGPEGKGLQVLGRYGTLSALRSAVPSPEIGDAYGVGTEEENTVYIYTRNGGGEGIPDWQPFGSLKGAQGDPGKNGLTPYVGEDGCWWLGEESTGILADPSALSALTLRAESAAEAASEARAGAQSAEAAAKNAALSAEDRKREAAAAAGNAETFAAEAEASKKVAEEKRLLATRQAEAAEASAKRAESHAASMENAVTLADQSAARALLAAQATAEDRAAVREDAASVEDAHEKISSMHGEVLEANRETKEASEEANTARNSANESASAAEAYAIRAEDAAKRAENGGGGNGKDGASAYDIWLAQGNSGTEADFLESLKGETGERGLPGLPGEPGMPGEPGYTPIKGIDYFDGKDGADGADGQRGTGILKVSSSLTSYTTSTEGKTPIKRMALSTIKSEAGVSEVLVGDLVQYSYYHYHIYYIDATYAYMDTYVSIRGATGATGEAGSNGKDGANGTSVTVSSVSESDADGGSNVVTFSDGTTLTVKNGRKGSTGERGPQGPQGPAGSDASVTAASIKTALGYTPADGVALADKVSKNGITLGLFTDGKYYIFVDGSPVGTGFELSGNSGDVFGYVDENNNIVLNGNLADGTYSIKYELEDEDGNAKTVDIGNLEVDTNVYYTVTNTLTNCTNSNSATEAVKGESYSATITANSGFELKSLTVTMGGSPVSVSGGSISIAEVTGNIVIVAVAEETVVEIVNQIPLSVGTDGKIYNGTGYKTGTRLNGSGAEVSAAGVSVTGFIPAKSGDVVYVKGIAIENSGYSRVHPYDASKTSLGSTSPIYTSTFVNEGNGVYSCTLTNANTAFIRVASYSTMDGTEIVTINQPIV